MGYVKNQIIEDDIERERKINKPKKAKSEKKENPTKKELIEQIIKEDSSQNREILESFSEYHLKHVILKRILQQKKKGLLLTKKRQGNPFEEYEKRLEENRGPIL